jgi:predicted RNase H-like HicB family nuclease
LADGPIDPNYQPSFNQMFASVAHAEVGEYVARAGPPSTFRVASHRHKLATMEREDTSVPRQFDVVIERDSEGYYVASVPQIPACHTQARSLDEVTERIREAIELCLEVEGTPQPDLEFVGIQRVTIAA